MGSLLENRDEGQASIEWKAGIDGQRTPLVLGFEQIPGWRHIPHRIVPVPRRDQTPNDESRKVDKSKGQDIPEASGEF